jgi:hypothetical protein
MDAFSVICGAIAGAAALTLILTSVFLYAQGLRRRSWSLALTGFAMTYAACLAVNFAVCKIQGMGADLFAR